MISGFVLRNGQNGTDDLTATGRTTIPLWAQRAYNGDAECISAARRSTPRIRSAAISRTTTISATSATTLGTHFDLNEYNVRYCVTPEFPGGHLGLFHLHRGRRHAGVPVSSRAQLLRQPDRRRR